MVESSRIAVLPALITVMGSLLVMASCSSSAPDGAVVDDAGPTLDAATTPPDGASADSGPGVDSGVGVDSGPDVQFNATLESCLANCEQPACASLVGCVDPVPVDWQGPVEMYRGAAAPPSCDPTFGEKLLDGGEEPLSAPLACSGSGFCAPLVNPMPGGPVSCIPNTIQPAHPALGWTMRAAACKAPAASTGTCSGARLCAPRPSTTFRQSICIANTTGDVPCPAGSYSERFVYGTTMFDSRTCGPTQCVSVGQSCATTQPTSIGDVSATGLATVCCLP